MAHLITKHDPFHVHKLLGLFVLLHFLYRFLRVILVGDAFFLPNVTDFDFIPYDDNDNGNKHVESWTSLQEKFGYVWIDLVAVGLHGVLSLSSLVFKLPQKRNFSSPMIWPEFRLHSIAFAVRHVLATWISLLGLWPKELFANAIMKLALVLGTISAARHVTEMIGDKEKRTTNSMPYPENVSLEEQQLIKNKYSQAQFHAVVHSVIEDPTCNFFPLLGIQIAPFMMTLVRKGKINCQTYHRIYAFSLWLPFFVVWLRLLNKNGDMGEVFLMGFVSRYIALPLRFRGYNQETVWCISLIAALACKEMFLPTFDAYLYNKNWFFWPIVGLYTYMGPTVDKFKYLPLFRKLESECGKPAVNNEEHDKEQ